MSTTIEKVSRLLSLCCSNLIEDIDVESNNALRCRVSEESDFERIEKILGSMLSRPFIKTSAYLKPSETENEASIDLSQIDKVMPFLEEELDIIESLNSIYVAISRICYFSPSHKFRELNKLNNSYQIKSKNKIDSSILSAILSNINGLEIKGDNEIIFSSRRSIESAKKLLIAYSFLFKEIGSNSFKSKLRITGNSIVYEENELSDEMARVFSNLTNKFQSGYLTPTQLDELEKVMLCKVYLAYAINENKFLKYFSSVGVKRCKGMEKDFGNTIRILTSDESAKILLQNFIEQMLGIKVVKADVEVTENQDLHYIEIPENEITSNINFFKSLPLHSQGFFEIMDLLNSIEGVGIVRLRAGVVRIRCNKEVYKTLSKIALKSYNKVKKLPSSVQNNEYFSNRLLFSIWNLYNNRSLLKKVMGGSVQKKSVNSVHQASRLENLEAVA